MLTKVCSKCGEEKDLESFHNQKIGKLGKTARCKECESLRGKIKHQRNKAEINRKHRDYYHSDKKRESIRAKKYQLANKGIINANTAKYRAKKLNATPQWLSPEQLLEIKEIYEFAHKLGYHVDHIVPLQGTSVSGLHVPANLQILPPNINQSKGNRYDG